VKIKFFKTKNDVCPVVYTIYAIELRTNNEPNCVHIKKYKDAWIPRL